MSTMTLDQQLLLAHLAVKHNWISPENLRQALRNWEEGSLGDFLRDRQLLTPEQLWLVNEELSMQEQFSPFSPGHTLLLDTGMELDKRSGDSVRLPATHPPSEGGGTGCRYSKVRPHAKGGLGEVFVAKDEELNREVALKEIRQQYADYEEARSRFIREAEITGTLEHPGVVPVYGLGLYPDGRPFYAMRFIRGEGMDKAIERFHQGKCQPLDLRRLLNRFVAVCNAVCFAHSKGVIHRDIKPSNVMLGDFGETLLVDWGLAKRMGEGEKPPTGGGGKGTDLGDPSTTQRGQVMGTPGYMPPEQARGLLEQMGPASDVFSLGATLYCILTGQAPYKEQGDLIRAAAMGEWKPACQVKQDVPAALEAICARAMSTEPGNRYASARELALDVEHWLADEPVKAYPDPLMERVRRWGRKQRTLVTTGVVVLLVSVVGLLLGLAAVGAEQRRTAAERDRAIDNEYRALLAEGQAQANLMTAQANLKLARDAVNETLDLAKDHPLLNQEGMREVRKLLLEKALPFFKKFRAIKRDDSDSRQELADQLYRLALITDEIGNKIEARRSYEQAREIQQTLVRVNPEVSRFRFALAGTLTNLGILLREEGKRGAALNSYTAARTLLVPLIKAHPGDTRYQNELARTLNNLGNLLRDEGKRSEALKAYTQARDLRQTLVKAYPKQTEYQMALAGTLANMGVVLQEEGKRSEALKAYSQARDLQQTLVKARPEIADSQTELALTLANVSNLLREEGNRAEALKVAQQARDIVKSLVKAQPKVTRYRNDLALTLTNLGTLFHEEGKKAEALDAYIEARDLRQELMKQHPGVAKYQSGLARTLTNLGILMDEEGNRGEALNVFSQSSELLQRLVKAHPRINSYQNELARTLTNLGILLHEDGKRLEALKAYERARDLRRVLVKTQPTIPEYSYALAGVLINIGVLLRDEGKGVEALRSYSEAATLLQQLVQVHPRLTPYRIRLIRVYLAIADLRRKAKQLGPALVTIDAALAQTLAVLKNEPKSEECNELFWRLLSRRAMTLGGLKRHGAAADEWARFLLVAPASYRPFGRISRAESLARSGDGVRAMVEAYQVIEVPELQASSFYDLACVAAISAITVARDSSAPLPRREHLAETYARTAVVWLRRAYEEGYFEPKAQREDLKTNPDLKVLRNRDDFKQFLKAVNSGE